MCVFFLIQVFFYLFKEMQYWNARVFNYDEATRKRWPLNGSHKSGHGWVLSYKMWSKQKQCTVVLDDMSGWILPSGQWQEAAGPGTAFALCLTGVWSVQRVQEIHCVGNMLKPITLRIHLGSPFYCNFPGVLKEAISLQFPVTSHNVT